MRFEMFCEMQVAKGREGRGRKSGRQGGK